MSKDLFPETRVLLSDTTDLTNIEFRVLMHYAKHMDKALTTFVSQTTIANKIGTDQPSVAKVVRSLVKKGYLIFLPKKGRSNVMKLIIKGKEDDKDRIRSVRGSSSEESIIGNESGTPRCSSDW